MPDHRFCLHGHFYQLPRGNPFQNDALDRELGAEPYKNFNEKATALCYAPNAELGNFDLMSFNLGSALSRWMERSAPDTYRRILEADRRHHERFGVGNALAQPAHHAILPLCRPRDMALMVRWGVITFEHRFGRPPEGMWLPDLAVNLATLQTLADNGIQFTIIGQAQVDGAVEGAGPYWVKLPSGGRIAVYVRDDGLSNSLAFELQALGGAGRWARATLMPLKKHHGRLLLVAVEGETFGHHFAGEEHFLRWLLAYEAHAVGYDVTTLVRDLRDHAPTGEVVIKEHTAWTNTGELNRWRGALRGVFDRLSERLDEAFLKSVSPHGADAGRLQENFLRVRLGQITEDQLLAEAGLGRLSAESASQILSLLRAEFHRQRMYTSTAFFYGDLQRVETRYAMADAVQAALLAQRATGDDFLTPLKQEMALIKSEHNGLGGAQLMDDVLAWARESGAL